MRHLLVICLLLAIFLAGSIYFDVSVRQLADDMLDLLAKADTPEAIDELARTWKEQSAVVELMIDHSEIDILNQTLWSMQVEVRTNEDDFQKSRKLTEEMLHHIAERNTFSWENVF